jgi:hypothetical protein
MVLSFFLVDASQLIGILFGFKEYCVRTLELRKGVYHSNVFPDGKNTLVELPGVFIGIHISNTAIAFAFS